MIVQLRATALTGPNVSQKQIMHYVRQLCGVGTCNHWAGPAMHAASMGIAMCESLLFRHT